jgi:hypothetical protein
MNTVTMNPASIDSFAALEELCSQLGPDIAPLDIEIGGKKTTILVRQLGFTEAHDISAGVTDDHGKVKREHLKQYRVGMLLRSIVKADGSPALTADYLAKLRNSTFDALENQILAELGLTTTASKDIKSAPAPVAGSQAAVSTGA